MKKSTIDISRSSSSVKAASAAQFGSKLTNIGVQFVITMILARLLTPDEYGTVAVLTAFSGIFSILADAGIPTAIAQSHDLHDADYRSLFFTSLVMGLVLEVAFFLLSFAIAWFYNDAIYIPLGAMMSFAVLFNALNMVPSGLLTKERKFNLIAIRLVVCTIVVGSIAVLLAFLGCGCYAIVANTVLTSLFVFLWNLKGSQLRMSARGWKTSLRKVGRFSAYNLGSSLIGWFAGNADSLITGKAFGAAALGYYNKAYSLYGASLNALSAPIVSTLLPFLSPIRDDKLALREQFLRVFRKLSFLCALLMAIMNVCASEIILIAYGDGWEPAIPLLTALALAIYARGVNGAFAGLITADGRSDLLMRSTGINTVVTVGMIILGCSLGSVQSLAVCVAIAYNLEMILPIRFSACECLAMGFWRFTSHLAPDVLGAAMGIGLAAIIPWDISNVFLSLTAKATFVTVTVFTARTAIGKLMFHERMKDFLL